MSKKRSENRSRGEWPAWTGWLVLLPLVVLLPGLGAFPTPPLEGAYSDLITAHYPYTLELRRQLLAGQAPWWSPLNLGGAPLAANPLYGLWYPLGWAALVLPLPLGFNLLSGLHLALGGWGMLRLLRAEGLGQRAAVLGALAFAGLPKLYAHYGAGHLTLVYAVSWTPWLLLAWRKAVRAGSNPWERLYPGVVWGLVWLADVRWGAYGGLAGIIYLIAHSRILVEKEKKVQVARGALLRTSSLAVMGGMLSLILAAPLLTPLAGYLPHTTRAEMSAADVLAFSLPPERVLGLLAPDYGGTSEWVVYAGVVVLSLALLAAVFKRGWFWLGLALGGLLWALGAAWPFAGWLANLPGIGLLRVPARAMFLSGMGLAALAGYGVQALLGKELESEAVRKGRLALTGLTGFGLLMALGVWAMSDGLPLAFAWGPGMLFVAARWTGNRMAGKMTGESWFIVILLLASADLLGMNYLMFGSRASGEVYDEASQAAVYLAEQSANRTEGASMERVYSPSYSLPQATAARNGLQLADGVDPLQPAGYAERLAAAAGVTLQGYSVTLPPLEGDDPHQANQEALPDAQALGALNIGYVAAHYDLEVEGLEPVKQFGEMRLYRVAEVRPRVWIERDDAIDLVEQLEWRPGWLRITAVGPGRLHVLETALPGWYARREGMPIELEAVDGHLTIALAPGEQEILLRYWPPGLMIGLALGIIGWAVSGFAYWRWGRGQESSR